jgi:hypothetical protein
MSYSDRIPLYSRIEGKRGRPLISYVTSLRHKASAQMAQDVISEIARILNRIDSNENAIDFLIVSNGGDPIVSGRIISMLRERFQKVGVLLPYVAYSAATLLALGADEIVMHKFSNLGPVDPQLNYKRKSPDGNSLEQVTCGSEDIKYFMEFVCKDVGITDQEQKQKSFELLCKEVGSIPIGVAKRSSQLSVSMGEKLLCMHMEDKNKAKTIAEALNSSFYHHGYALSRSEAEKIGLPIIIPDQELEELLWQVWESIESEMECRKPFNPIEIISNDSQANTIFGPVPMISVPANAPPQVQQQLINQALQQLNLITCINPIDYEILFAVLENTTCRSEMRVKGKLSVTRMADMNLAINDVKFPKGWTFYADNV